MKPIFVLLLLPLQLFSQDISGIWVGTIATSQTEMPFELAINQDMTGYSMITFTYKGDEKVAVKRIMMIRKDSTFNISDDKIVYDNFATKSRSIKTFCELSVKMVDTIMVMSGAFHTRTRDLRKGDEDLATGTITLRKQNIHAQTRLINKLDTLKLSNTLAFSSPEAAIKENPVTALSEKETHAVAKNPVKDVAAVQVQQQANSQKDVAAVQVQQQSSTEKDVAAAKVQQGANLEKDVAAAKVQEQTNSEKGVTAANVQQRPHLEKGKNESYNNVRNNISAAPVTLAPQKIIVPAAADVALRSTEVIRTIDFKSDSLTLTLYDNGIVDGDTVSVILNGEVIIPKQGLSEQAYRKVIKIPPGSGDSLQLVLYAENLGSIPPNTGLLIIDDGSERYEVRFKGDMKNSSAVRLRRKQ